MGETLRTTPEAYYRSEYDLTGAMTGIEVDEGKNASVDSRRELSYDPLGRLASETIIFDSGSPSFTTSYGYDRVGNRTSITWSDGYTARYVYDDISRLVQVCEDSDGNGTCERVLSRYAYDDLGRPISARFGDNQSSSIYYSFEDDGDLAALRHDFGGTIRDFAHSYNANGELTASYASDGSWLWSATGSRTVNYDVANERNELLGWTESSTHTSAFYDANGNYSGNGVNSFASHNSSNQMTGYTAASGATANYIYGPMGRRIETTLAGVRTRYAHVGDMEIAEYALISGTWKIKTRYIPGAGVDQRVAMITVNTSNGATIAREYYHSNRLGSVIAMAAENGSVTANYVYTPYGVEDYGSSGNPFRYTGRRYDAAIDLYYYRARYYDAQLGRFLETDPVLYADQMNLYAYVGNSPLNGTDPTGEFANFLIGAGIGLIAEGLTIAAEGGNPLDVGANLDRYAVAGLVGAVSGGLGGLASKGIMTTARSSTGILRAANQVSSDAIGGGLGAVAGEATNQMVTEGELNGRDVFEAGVAGLIVGGTASSAGQLAGIVDDAGRAAAVAAAGSELAVAEPIADWVDSRADVIAGED
mgnify:CR=1 FL=1